LPPSITLFVVLPVRATNGNLNFYRINCSRRSGTPEVATVTPLSKDNSVCSSEAVVTAVWNSPHRAVTTIYARVSSNFSFPSFRIASATGHVVKCDVIVDDIHHIEIETTTQELYLHNTPESLTVVAYDEYGNTFSTLHGVPFEWRIHGDTYSGAADGHTVLRFLTWTESEYATPPSIAVLESRGMQGHMQLVSGLRTGSAVVDVSLWESMYSSVPAAHVRLLVMANAQLSPALAYLMPGSELKLSVRVVQQGSEKDIPMPSSQYHLLVNDTELAELDPADGCTVLAKLYGQTEITLFDRNVEEALENVHAMAHVEAPGDEQLRLPRRRLPTSLILVVEPAYFGFTMQAFIHSRSAICQRAASVSAHRLNRPVREESQVTRDWIMEVGHMYTVFIELFDHNGHRLYASDNLRVELKTSSDKLILRNSTANGTMAVVQPTSPGPFTIEARLLGFTDKSGRLTPSPTSVFGSEDIVVHPITEVRPPLVILPWPISINESTGYQLTVSGGYSPYVWSVLQESTNTGKAVLDEAGSSISNELVSINQKGELTAMGFGEALIVAASSSYPHLCGTAKVLVTSPAGIEFVPGPAEVVVRHKEGHKRTTIYSGRPFGNVGVSHQDTEVLLVGLAVLDSERRSMTDCRGLPITITPLDPSIIEVLPERLPARPSNGPSSQLSECLRIRVVGLQVGSTELEASYESPDSLSSSSSGTNEARENVSSTIYKSRFAIAVYRNILFMDPILDKTHVALGSTREFTYSFGPSPWIFEPSSHFSRVLGLDPSGPLAPLDPHSPPPMVIREPYVDKSRPILSPGDSSGFPVLEWESRPMVFSMRCESLGSFRFALEVGNKPTALNTDPIIMRANFTIICELPAKLQLTVHRPLPVLPVDISSCPLVNLTVTALDDEVPIANTAPFVVSLSFFGPNGHKLEAVDSMLTTVAALSTNQADSDRHQLSKLVLNAAPKIQRATMAAPDASSWSSPYPFLGPHFILEPREPGKSVGAIHISVRSHLNPAYSSRLKLSGSQLLVDEDLLATVLARFHAPAHISAAGNRLQIFHHTNVEIPVPVLGGSGYFHVTDGRDTLQITPNTKHHSKLTGFDAGPHEFRLKSRRIGSTVLRILDLCFPRLPPSMEPVEIYNPYELFLNVDVVGLSALKLHAVDRIQLGGQIVAIVEPLDNNGQPLFGGFTHLLDLTILQQPTSLDKGVQSAVQVLGVPDLSSASYWHDDPDTPKTEAHLARFNVRGLSLGSASLTVSCETIENESRKTVVIQSNAVDIQVFAPLRLYPCNFNLLLGAEYELRASGGPHPSAVEFFVEVAHKAVLTLEQTRPTSVLIRAGGTPGTVSVRALTRSRSSAVNVSSSDANSDGLVVTSEASCNIHVVSLSGIRIGCPLVSSAEIVPLPHVGIGSSSPRDLNTLEERFLIACRPEEQSGNCGVAPLWIEGLVAPIKSNRHRATQTGTASHVLNQSFTDIVTPLGLSGSIPALRFKWRLNPPQPTSAARLIHSLEGFNVDIPETHLASGMTLVGLSPGRVTIHVTVEATDLSLAQLVGSTGNPVRQLLAQLVVLILPPLGLQSPFVPLPRQLLMSPDSQYQLRPRVDVPSHSHVHYEVIAPPTPNTSNLELPVTITSAGFVQAGRSDRVNFERRATIKISSWPKDHLQGELDSRTAQTMFLDVIVKPPRYVHLSAISGAYIRSTGLPVGGPYQLQLTHHDDLGRSFDAIADKYLQLRSHLQRTDLIEAVLADFVQQHQTATVLRGLTGSSLSLRVLPVSSDAADTKRRTSSDLVNSVLRLGQTEESSGFWPTYLSIPHGGEQESIGLSSMVVSQWTCLPELIDGARWSSSDPSVLWVDRSGRLLLARRPGKAYLLYTVGPTLGPQSLWSNSSYGSRLSYLRGIRLKPLLGEPTQTPIRLIFVDADSNVIESGHAVLPAIPLQTPGNRPTSTTVRFLVQFESDTGQKDSSDHTSCFVTDENARHELSANSPIHCSIQLSSFAQHRIVPSWLSLLVLWSQNDTLQSTDLISSASVLSEFVNARLEPVTKQSAFYRDSIQWQCILRTTSLWHQFSSILGLVLDPDARLVVHLKGSEAQEGEYPILASSEIIPLPGFQVVVPPALVHPIDPGLARGITYLVWFNNPSELTQRMLVFVPPATSAMIVSKQLGPDRLVVRSKLPNVVDVTGPPRPVYSLTEVSLILAEYMNRLKSATPMVLNSLPSSLGPVLDMWRTLAAQQVQQIENEAAVSSDGTLIKQQLLWLVELRASIGDAAVNTIVDVIVSLRQTGQHVSIPVQVHLPSKAELSRSMGQTSWRLQSTGFSWLHLFALILITLLFAIVVHVMLRSGTLVSSSDGLNVTKDLPAGVSPSATRTSPRQLWTHGYQPFSTLRSPNLPSGQSVYGTNISPPPGGLFYGGPSSHSSLGDGDMAMEERKWRRVLSGGSPSRLRDTFDSI
ncbi:nuclear pore complex protein Nup210, partial [Clonorchis sinensis]